MDSQKLIKFRPAGGYANLDAPCDFMSGHEMQASERDFSMRKYIWTLTAAGAGIAAMAIAAAGKQSAQYVPQAIRVPADQRLYLTLHAQGDQIYSCKGEAGQFAWILKAPEAQLTDAKGKPFGRHFAGPTWESSDGSSVTGTLAAKVDSGDAEAIPWLLVNVASHKGDGVLARAKTIQRINTKGGKAPGTGCDAEHVNQERRVEYSADYNFYAAK